MSSPNHNLIEFVGRYAQCPSCRAPNCDPVPPRYPVTMRGRSPSCEITPHLPTCAYLRTVRKGGEA